MKLFKEEVTEVGTHKCRNYYQKLTPLQKIERYTKDKDSVKNLQELGLLSFRDYLHLIKKAKYPGRS